MVSYWNSFLSSLYSLFHSPVNSFISSLFSLNLNISSFITPFSLFLLIWEKRNKRDHPHAFATAFTILVALVFIFCVLLLVYNKEWIKTSHSTCWYCRSHYSLFMTDNSSNFSHSPLFSVNWIKVSMSLLFSVQSS